MIGFDPDSKSSFFFEDHLNELEITITISNYFLYNRSDRNRSV